jgi:hypothetical protein
MKCDFKGCRVAPRYKLKDADGNIYAHACGIHARIMAGTLGMHKSHSGVFE